MATTAPPTTLTPPPSASGGGSNSDRARLLWTLETILLILDRTVHLEPSIFPEELQPYFRDAWPDAEKSLMNAISVVRNPARFRLLYPRLRRAGLTGPSLQLKTQSLYYYGKDYVGDILTYPAKKTWTERIARLFKPTFKIMNSLMGSLKGVLPGIDIAKEFKEHIEATVDALQKKE